MFYKKLQLLLLIIFFANTFLQTTLQPNFIKCHLFTGKNHQKVLILGDKHDFDCFQPKSSINEVQYNQFISLFKKLDQAKSCCVSFLIEGGISKDFSILPFDRQKPNPTDFFLQSIFATGQEYNHLSNNLHFYNIEYRPMDYLQACYILSDSMLFNPYGNNPDGIKNFSQTSMFDFSLNDLITQLELKLKKILSHIVLARNTVTKTLRSNNLKKLASDIYIKKIEQAYSSLTDLKTYVVNTLKIDFLQQPLLYAITTEWIKSMQYYISTLLHKQSKKSLSKEQFEEIETFLCNLTDLQNSINNFQEDIKKKSISSTLSYKQQTLFFQSIFIKSKKIYESYFHDDMSYLEFIDKDRIRRDLAQLIIDCFSYLIELHTFLHIMSIQNSHIVVMTGNFHAEQIVEMLQEAEYHHEYTVTINTDNLIESTESMYAELSTNINVTAIKTTHHANASKDIKTEDKAETIEYETPNTYDSLQQNGKKKGKRSSPDQATQGIDTNTTPKKRKISTDDSNSCDICAKSR